MVLFLKCSSKDSSISGDLILIFVPGYNLYPIYLLLVLILLLFVPQDFGAKSLKLH